MAIETILGFRNIDSTENLNARLAGLVPKGIVKGGIVVPEPASLQVRIKGSPTDGVVFLAFAKDGMMVRERAEERVLPIVAGLTNVIVLRCKYLESQPPIVSFEVMTLGAYNNDLDKDSLIRFASVTPPANATAVLPEHINSSFRDSIEGFKRGVVRGVVDTKVDLPATSGFPATAEINFTSNTFVDGSSISINTGATSVRFPLESPISFPVASPGEPGLSRVNPSQKTIVSVVQDSLGYVTVTTSEPHGFARQTVRISDNTAAQANSLWTIEEFTEYTFSFQGTLTTPWSGTGGSVVDTFTPATVTATIAPGNTHTLIPGQQFIITGATEQTFNGLFTVQTVLNAQKILFQQIGYPSRDSGNGKITKVGYSLPPNAVEIGESGDITAKNFEHAVRSSELDGDIKIFAMGSSLQLEARVSGSFGNTFTITKDEPNATVPSIVLSDFKGGIDPNAVAAQATAESLQKGDLYVVLFGELGTIELWGFDGSIFRNLTSASASTLLDFHRRNFFINEKHLSENEKAALVGSKGVPGPTNRYVTEQDTTKINDNIASALQGADTDPPGQTNKFLTEARVRGQRGSIEVPSGQNYVVLPLGQTWVVGVPPELTFDASKIDLTQSKFTATKHGFLNGTKVNLTTTAALPGGLTISTDYYVVEATADSFKLSLTKDGTPQTISSSGSGTVVVCDDTYAKQFFNLIYTDSLYASGGCTEYSQQDFSPVTVSGVFVDSAMSTVLNPYQHCSLNGTYPRPDALILGKPQQLYIKLSATPNNGSATVLYSESVIERNRKPQADMLMGPQRIIPAELQDVVNKTKELRFHAGIATSGTSVSFPANLFYSENLQGFKYRRFVGNRPVTLTSSFTIDFAAGTGTSGIVESFVPVSYSGKGGQWTRYALCLTTSNKIKVVHIASLLEKTTDLSFSTVLANVAVPSLAMTDGSYLFATVAVKVNNSANGIDNLGPTNLEFYTYHNSRDPGAVIVCGDGTLSFGHFSGPNAHLRAFSYAQAGDTIRLLQGTYTGNLVIDKDDITLDCSAGAILQNVGGTILSIVANRFRALAPRFNNCALAVNIQPGSDNFRLEKPSYSSTVISKLKSPPRILFNSSNFSNSIINVNAHGLLAGAAVKLSSTGALPSGLSTSSTYYIAAVTDNTFRLATDKSATNLVGFTNGSGSGTHTGCSGQITEAHIEDTAIAKWIVTDGSNIYGVGDFNSPDGIQQAHDAASEGDVILVYPGSYNKLNWTKSNLVLKGFGGAKVKISGGGANFTAVTVSGSNNQFENLHIENAGTGIVCNSGAVHNKFGVTVDFADTVKTNIKFPTTAATKHYNYHPSICGRVQTGNSFPADNPLVTVGDGVVSWGDYVGSNAINVALQEEGEGTIIQVFRGEYLAIQCNANSKSVIGSPGQKTVIRANALLDSICVNVDGNKNFFKDLYIQADNNDADAIGLTTVGIKVNGSDNHFENIYFPETGSERIESHLKYKVVSGARNRFMPHTGAPVGEISWTVGDGVRSFGDFNGSSGISAAILALPAHPRSLMGVTDGSSVPTEVQTWPGKISGASGALAKFTAPRSLSFTSVDIVQGTSLTGSTFNIASHGLTANEPVTFISTGSLPNPLAASPLGPTVVKYYIINVEQNSFQVSTAANGAPIYLADFGAGTHTLISSLPFNFTADDLYRNINISSASSPDNQGSFLITEVLDRSSVILTRLDGKVFTDEPDIVYDFVSGAKITVMPGVYDPFVIPRSKNDVEISAWGAGSDVIIKGFIEDTPVSPIIKVDGSRNFIRGFRFSGGIPVTGVAIEVNGSYNTFSENRFETANRYSFAPTAIGNRVFDSAEAEGRTAYTVSIAPSRADYTGSNEASIQAALDAISRDNHLATVYLGKGTWTFRKTVNVPANIQLFGTGYETRLVGDGSFPAFQLNSGGGQSFVGVHIENFTYSLAGPADRVYVVDSWQTNTIVDPSVTGEIRFFGETKLFGDVTIDGSLLVSDNITLGDGGILATTASVGTIYDTPSTVNLGTAVSADDSLYNIATGSTASGYTKTVNIGTHGLLGSTTNVKIGSTNAGTTTLQNYTVVEDSLKVTDVVAVGVEPTSAAITTNGKILTGDRVTSPSRSNVVDFSATNGSQAFRPFNIVDSSAAIKVASLDSSSGPTVELQQWNSTASSMIAYWDFYSDSRHFGVRDRLSPKNRIFIDEQGRVLFGSAFGTASESAAEIDPDYSFNIRGNTVITNSTASNALLVSGSSSSPSFVVKSDGAVGVGTLTPGSRLQINGGAAVGYDSAIVAPDNGLIVNNRLGVGTSSPANKLSVRGGRADILSGSVSSSTGLEIGRTSSDFTLNVAGTSGEWSSTAVAGDTVLRTENATAKIILQNGSGSAALTVRNGSVGVGTINPVSRFNVQDSSASDAVRITQVSSGKALVVEGVTLLAGTTSIAAALKVDGDFVVGDKLNVNATTGHLTTESLKVNDDFNVADKVTVDAQTGDLTVSGSLAANGGITTTLTSLDIFPNVSYLTLENNVTSDLIFSLAGGATSSGATKSISLGAGGLSGSTTSIVLGARSSDTSVEIWGSASIANSVDVTGEAILRSNVSLLGFVSFETPTLLSSQPSASIFSSVPSIFIGDNAANTRLDVATGAIASGVTKVVNIGTGGLLGSNTNIKIGSLYGGTTTLQNYTVIDDSLKINTDLNIGTGNRFSVVGSTGNTTITGTLAVNSGNLLTTAVSCSVFSSASSIVIGGTASSSSYYGLGIGPTVVSATKTIDIGTSGAVGSITNINIGSANTTAGTTTINNSLVVRGDLTVQGTTATVNTTTLDVKDANITLNKGGSDVTAIGSGITVEGTSAVALGKVLFDSTLPSRFKLGATGLESEVVTVGNSQTITSSKTFNAPQVISANAATSALTITQTGIGHAFLVEDELSPDSSPFVVDRSGKIGIGTLTTTAELNVSGRALVGNQITNSATSNIVSTSVTDGLNAYRTINVVDSGGIIKIASNSANHTGIEIQTWNSTYSSNSGYWDLYSQSGSFGVRDRISGLNKIFAHQNGTVLIGGTTTDAATADSYITTNFGSTYSLVAEGSVYVSGILSVANISNATLDACSLTNLRRANLATELASINTTTQILTLTNGLPVQRIQSGTTLAGMTLGTDGRMILLTNETANDITILHESSVAATATQRFNIADGVRFLLKPKASVLAYYNGTLGRWLVLGDNPPPVAIPYRSVSANYTLVPSDYFVTGTGAAALTLTLPTAVGVSGTVYYLKNRLNAGLLLTVATTSSQKIDDATAWSLARYETLSVISNGANWEVF